MDGVWYGVPADVQSARAGAMYYAVRQGMFLSGGSSNLASRQLHHPQRMPRFVHIVTVVRQVV